MKLLGFELKRVKAEAITGQPVMGGGWYKILEYMPGAFQAAMRPLEKKNLLAFSAVYAAANLIASDIAKLQLRLMSRRFKGKTWDDFTEALPEGEVLLKPNDYQTLSQFVESWLLSKLLHGNTFVLRRRDGRGIVRKLYILDPCRVTPLVASSGDIFYKIDRDDLSEVESTITVPSSEIIHDRYATLWHPLVGVSPIFACASSATQGIRIQNNSARFFENMSRPSGMLTAPGTISDEVANRLKEQFDSNFSGINLGRLFVAGDDLKYESLTIPAQDAQLIEQLRWTVEDVARAFRVPLHMLGAGPAPALASVSALEQAYYSRTLQSLIEQFEQCLDAGLGLPSWRRTEFDLDGLLRMDMPALYEALGKGVNGGWLAPNEARERVNLPPVAGGDTPYLQQQNYSLAALDKRDRAGAAPSTPGGAPNGT